MHAEPEEGFTTFGDIAPGGLEIASVPGVGYISGAGGEVQEFHDFLFRVTAHHAHHVADVPLVHADEKVEVAVVGTGHLTGGLSLAGDAMGGQHALGWGIDAISNLLSRGGGRFNVELVGESCFLYQVFHDKLGHGTAADVAVADKEYLLHGINPFF